MTSDGASSISVTVRVRPFTIREAAQLSKCDDTTIFLGDGSLAPAPAPKLSQKGLRPVIKVVDDKCLVFDPPEDNPVQKFSRSLVPSGKRVKDQTFGFDRIFDENASQGEVYEATTRPLLDSVLDGYNATVFAYGATGCGKTHTITGTVQQPGIIFMAMQELFERVAELATEKVTEISLSYLEIYNETIRDLLAPPGSKAGLMLREDAHQTVSVAGLSSHRPQNVQEVMDLIMKGNEMRTMSPTEANATSSRSHAVLQINVAQKDRNASVEEPHTMATLSIIDLAGSERASATKNRGERLLEGANINKSLLALGSCINALCDPRKRNHVPYRNSKLTRLLKFSLGGNCKTVMIVCVSPSSAHFDETQNTLRYANRAKNIQTKVTRNVYNVNRHVKDFLVKIDEQMALINELKAQQKDYEALAFAKFKKQNERKEIIAREGVQRIRSAYEHSAAERQERTNNMIKLKQLGRRIAMLTSWIAAFDAVCDGLDDDEPMKNMHAIRKTAQGILMELESGRHHCQQKVLKSSWDRAMNTALEHSLRQLNEVDTGDMIDSETLRREVELLRSTAEREALAAVNDQDKFGDAATIQVLLQAHFETIAALENLNRMSVDEAVESATQILGKMLKSASIAASYVVKPDGSLTPVEAFAPTKAGTPKRRKQNVNSSMLDGSPLRPKSVSVVPSHVLPSPVKASPRRRALLGAAKKGVQVSFTPKKRKSPIKAAKRVVRWRDDVEDGALAEFEKTPQKFTPSPKEESTTEIIPPQVSDLTASLAKLSTQASSPGSSPIPPPPEVSLPVPSKNSRFEAGFLSKKSDGSPNSSTIIPPKMTPLSSSDSDESPLRELDPSKAANRRSITPSSTNKPAVNGCADNSGTSSASNSDTENRGQPNKDEALKIREAVKRTSSVRRSGVNGSRTQRRRSPTAATATSGSPQSDSMFAAGHVRRMVMGKNDKENDWKVGVLSPRVHGIVSHSKSVGPHGNRRTTMSGTDVRSTPNPGDRAGVRMSSIAPSHGHSASRGSLMPSGKTVWR
ncbi:tubulin-dependent ATPase kip3 [Exophiala dermatitidis]|uniref:Tubulin-dependent ATPase kip3 n=1 Tax=Exophiala dermatitidis TaxID=5970 RepID=A0AAN6IVW8_EXODE|nr:tubulin-dependent ATPase kip3 [Exophiala dermatitidis]KAJ4523944.1 tubulin-dependent ATPase kip3 [Exophiala dermatitidis]KAJ4525785.1 tubulin-dependent ATPase kip3 [Exophiala dermatitidis]KAJ4537114.1 tubulin-dependent ATPase kip3 [Exophiala dermatitidis]KAJ4555289.1 tubulin-dependent ATPase kip3 [Exophiala dermatitidis]